MPLRQKHTARTLDGRGIDQNDVPEKKKGQQFVTTNSAEPEAKKDSSQGLKINREVNLGLKP